MGLSDSSAAAANQLPWRSTKAQAYGRIVEDLLVLVRRKIFHVGFENGLRPHRTPYVRPGLLQVIRNVGGLDGRDRVLLAGQLHRPVRGGKRHRFDNGGRGRCAVTGMARDFCRLAMAISDRTVVGDRGDVRQLLLLSSCRSCRRCRAANCLTYWRWQAMRRQRHYRPTNIGERLVLSPQHSVNFQRVSVALHVAYCPTAKLLALRLNDRHTPSRPIYRK